jgi:hypothetical protein
MSKEAMSNAYYICHNVQVILLALGSHISAIIVQLNRRQHDLKG